jgi:hypothetical protein
MSEITDRLASAPAECKAHTFNPVCTCGGSLHRVELQSGRWHWRHDPSGTHCATPRPVLDCDCKVCTSLEMLREITGQLVAHAHLEGNHDAISDLLSGVHVFTADIVAEAMFWGK